MNPLIIFTFQQISFASTVFTWFGFRGFLMTVSSGCRQMCQKRFQFLPLRDCVVSCKYRLQEIHLKWYSYIKDSAVCVMVQGYIYIARLCSSVGKDFVHQSCGHEFESRLKWKFSNFRHHLWLLAEKGMDKWFGAHYNQEVRFSSAVKCKKGPQHNQRQDYYYYYIILAAYITTKTKQKK